MLGFMVSYAFKEQLFVFMAAPMQQSLASAGIYSFRAIEITETIFVYLKLAIVAGIFLTLPFTFYQLWSFIAPGLHEKEKSAVAPLIFFSTLFFLLGAFFAYKIIIPFISDYLAQLTLANATIQMDVTVKSAFGFSLLMLLAFGLAFELPLVMFFLSLLGIMTARRYIKLFRYFVVISFIVSAILTPPDPISQLLMALPLNLLYLLGIGAVALSGHRKSDRDKRERISSRVWGALAVSLLLIGGGLGFGTWWLGQTHSPLQWIPSDAQSIISIHRSAILGPAAPPERVAALNKRLALPDSVQNADRVIFASGPDGKQLFIAVGACAAETPSGGRCVDDDWVLGDLDWQDTATTEKNAAKTVNIARLESQAPAWLWSSKPKAAQLRLMPGFGEGAPPIKTLVLKGQLHGDKPGVSLTFEAENAAAAGILQGRIDLWRAERSRKEEQEVRDSASAKDQVQILSLIAETLALSNYQWDLAAKDTKAEVLKYQVEKRRKALLTRLNDHKALLERQSGGSEEEAHNLLEKLGPDSVKTWKSEVTKAQISLHVVVIDPKGVDQLVGLLN
jgi:sec-independent protein translocase protein TatC